MASRVTMSRLLSVWLIIFIGLSQHIYLTSSSCNEAICGSIVSKCMLTQSCKCDLKNCTCCRDCFNCLDDLYNECCSCVEMCQKWNGSDVPLNTNSHVGELMGERYPQLFLALTEEQDPTLRWVAFTYPVHRDVSFFSPNSDREITIITVSSSQDVDKYEETSVNCTVAFMSQCMSFNKCIHSCSSMGAQYYRWFHDSCCECVADTCLNYGLNVSKCLKCNANESYDSDDLDEANVDLSDVESNETGGGNDEKPIENVTDEGVENQQVLEANDNGGKKPTDPTRESMYKDETD